MTLQEHQAYFEKRYGSTRLGRWLARRDAQAAYLAESQGRSSRRDLVGELFR